MMYAAELPFKFRLLPERRAELAEEAVAMLRSGLNTYEITYKLAQRPEWCGIHEHHVGNALTWWRTHWEGRS